MLADDNELRPRSLADLEAEMQAAAGRQSTPVAAVEAIRAHPAPRAVPGRGR